MTRQFIMILGMCSLISCNLLKGNYSKKTDHFNHSTQHSAKLASQTKSTEQFLILKDSLNEHVVAEITPIGVFSYSLAHGFKGSASAIKVRQEKKSSTKFVRQRQTAQVNQ